MTIAQSRAITILALALGSGAAQAHVPKYEVECLDCDSGLSLVPLAINNSGVVVATDHVGCIFPADCYRGQGYVINGGIITKSPSFGSDLGSTVIAINDSNLIVGFGAVPDQPYVFGYSWDGTQMVDLGDSINHDDGTPHYSRATSINNAGHIAGAAADGYHSSAVFLYVDGVMSSVPLPGISYINPIYGFHVNAKDHVAGTAEREQDDSYFVWINDGVTSRELDPDACYAEAMAINDSDVVVGDREVSCGVDSEAVIWKKGKTITLTLSGYVRYAQANAINNRGWVVGTACAYPQCTAFVYDGKKVMELNTRLKSKEWVWQQANGINDMGAIVGLASRGGKLHAVMATPR